MYDREILGELMFIFLAKIALARSFANELGDVFVANGNLEESVKIPVGENLVESWHVSGCRWIPRPR